VVFSKAKKENSPIDFDLKNGDRFSLQNRIAIDPDKFSIAIMIAITK
jgi:hypothetical protein